MALTTVNVTATIQTATGDPVAGAVVTARLDRTDVDPTDGLVTPSDISGTTDAFGVAVLALWPNTLGSAGSRYRVTVTDAGGVLLWSAYAQVPNEDVDLESVLLHSGDLPPWPAADAGREARVVQDIADLLHEPKPSDETRRKVLRWIWHVLHDAAQYGPWWFAQNLYASAIPARADLIDLRGDIDKLAALFAERRLTQLPLGRVLDLRADAAANGTGNGARYPTHYALEAGHRVHLWPAPTEAFTLQVLYGRPLNLAICPDEWEMIVLDGVLGLFGRHFDRNALTQDPQAFELRYRNALRRAKSASHDVVQVSPMSGALSGGQAVSADSAGRVATSVTVPDSVSGIGFWYVELPEPAFVVS